MPTRGTKGEGNRLTLNLEGHKRDEERPAIAVTLLGNDAKPLHVATAAEDGTIDIPPDALKKARLVVIGPAADDPASVDPETLIRYRPADFTKAVEAGSLNLARIDWQKWLGYLRCVTGTVRLCRRSPWWYEELYKLATEPVLVHRIPIPDPPPDLREIQRTAPISSAATSAASLLASGVSSAVSANLVSRIPAASSVSDLIVWPFRCQTICNGTVDVYRRTCCCEPWIIDDPRFPDLLHELREIVEGLRRVPPWPPDPPVGPGPGPDPAPPLPGKEPPIPPDPNPPDPPPFIEAGAIFKGGAIDEKALNATADLAALHAMPRLEVADYINARPYLRCWHRSCGTPVKVASGTINPDGRFSICWFDWPRIPPFPCSDEYAYLVRQRFGPFTMTIYDGVAANIWFAPGADATLTSYSSWAYACRDNGEPGTGAFVYLDLIGDTESWNLKTPNSTAWNSVGAPLFNDGLLFPATAAAALGQNLNRNMGGTLKLSYLFSEDMQTAPVNAKYYRIGITPATPADMSGAPTTAPTYLSAGLSWDKSVPDGLGGVDVVPVVLGPFSVGGQDHLYLIPFDRNLDNTQNEWNAGQYHGYVDTTAAAWSDPTVRHLITLEVFDGAGVRLRPTGTPATTAGGAENARAFTFRRRYQDLGPTANVPFGALTHMFWWDNRDLGAEITRLLQNGIEFPGECLFLEAHANATFAIRYRAFHPEELFQKEHSITWQRGVPVPPNPAVTGTLLASASNNVGEPPDPPGDSPPNTFAQMLSPGPGNPHPKCAFTVFLSITSKTTDGDYLGNYGITKTGAFALEIN
jgi:hypothetical protein